MPREQPKLRKCLAPGHEHLFLTTKNVRLCPTGRRLLDSVDAYYGAAGDGSGVAVKLRPWRPIRGVDQAAEAIQC